MKILFDQNISFRITKKIIEHFPDCKHVSDCGLRDAEDSDIRDYAGRNHYSIVTFVADFYDVSVIKGHPPKIIWIRTGNLTTNHLAEFTRIIHQPNSHLSKIISQSKNSPDFTAISA